MAVLTSKALHEQLSIIMGALTKAAVAEICEVVDEGYAVLQLEISRSHKENDDLRKKLHLIESIVVRGGGGGGGTAAAAEPEVVRAAEVARQAEAPPSPPQQPRGSDGGASAADPGGDGGASVTVVLHDEEELPDVVLIKDEDSDSSDGFDEDVESPADGATAAGRSLKRLWPGSEAGDRKSSSEPLALRAPAGTPKKNKSSSVYAVEPGGGAEMDAGDAVCSFASRLDPDLQLLHPDAAGPAAYFSDGAAAESPTNRAELDLSLTWTKPAKSHMTFASFHQNNADGDAFGLKLVSVSGSTDSQLSDSSNPAFEYDGADMMNFALYRDQSGSAQPGGARGKRFVCAVCSRTYATSQNLDVHMRIHTGERPFSCDQCGKKFTQSAHLKSHLSVHTGERPYACTLCSRSFIVKYSLKLHVNKCHPDAASE